MTDVALPEPGQIHVWQRSLSISVTEREAFLDLLDAGERSRAHRFVFEKGRDAFIASHGWLRTLLGRYLRADPRGIRFVLGERGKPAIPGFPLHFNLSHSDTMAACAVTRENEVGIDIERIRPMDDIENIARRFFHAEECRKLLALPQPEHALAFFRCWTRKEAYIKAIGDGLFAPLDGFEVTLAPAEPVAFVQIDNRPATAEWSLFEFDAGPDYAGAVAIRGCGWSVISVAG
jgi:4'-phosphopantetheinyl transferase